MKEDLKKKKYLLNVGVFSLELIRKRGGYRNVTRTDRSKRENVIKIMSQLDAGKRRNEVY